MVETRYLVMIHLIRPDGQVKRVLEELNASQSRSRPSAIHCDALLSNLSDRQRIIVRNERNSYPVERGTLRRTKMKET